MTWPFAVAVASLLAVATDTATLAAFDPDPAHVVGTGGAVGAALRHWVSERLADEGGGPSFPTATFAVNVVGSFVLGLVVFGGAGTATTRLVGIGVCGSFTTFSSFSVETVRLYERGARRLAVATALANLVVSLAGVGLARVLVAAVG